MHARSGELSLCCSSDHSTVCFSKDTGYLGTNERCFNPGHCHIREQFLCGVHTMYRGNGSTVEDVSLPSRGNIRSYHSNEFSRDSLLRSSYHRRVALIDPTVQGLPHLRTLDEFHSVLHESLNVSFWWRYPIGFLGRRQLLSSDRKVLLC